MKLNLKRTLLAILILIVIILVIIFIVNNNTQSTILDIENLSSMEIYDKYQEYGLNLTFKEYIMVCSLVQGETAGAELHWSELVAGIVYNRLNSKDFPNNVYDVLSQPNQFDDLKYYNNGITINEVTYQAVYNVFTNNAKKTIKKLDGAVYYCNPDILDEETASWFDENLTKTYDATYKSNGHTYHHIFYK